MPGTPDYQTRAHSKEHHSPGGAAVGARREAAPMDYDRKTNAEGATSQPVAGQENLRATVGMAEHHANHGGPAHQFRPPAAGNAHGYGHTSGQRSGQLRNSGHDGAHRIGKK
jgi:hypothetical protein